MKVTVENVSSVKKIMHVEIPEEKVVQELNDAYKQLKNTAKIKGFRKGKAPRSVLERMFKKDVHNDVSSKLIQDSFIPALEDADLDIVGKPEIDPPGLDKKGPYKYSATVEIKPEIEDIDYKNLTLKKSLYHVTDEEMDAQLKMLQKNLAKQNPISEDRGVRENDFVLIDYQGFKNGKPFAETQKTENFAMKIGEGKILKEFDEQLMGMKSGDNRDIKVKFPEDYQNGNLAKQEITFQVMLHEIREEVLPEIDDEFAKNFGKYETLSDLKDAITQNLDQGYAKRAEQEINEQIFQSLIQKTEFELPDSMVEYELERIIEEVERTLSYHNKSLEDQGLSREVLLERHRELAEKKVRRHLILDKIVEQENMTLSDEELENSFEEMAKGFNQPVEEIKKYYSQNEDNLEIFKQTLLEKQALELIIKKSTIEEVEPSLEQQTEI
ncbi:MAG: trigger factor [Deltaproteobacteria bacterium]|nr:trigger factor [Deltaproteobacteria bacterium]MBW2014867.1 trigger factor [Deltaproteobacteria bacterium]